MIVTQSSKYAIVYTWYHLNKEEISANHCINLNKPELLCSGKCYVRTVIESNTQTQNDQQIPPIVNFLETQLFIFTNSLHTIKDLGKSHINKAEYYLINYSFLLIHYIFHPPD